MKTTNKLRLLTLALIHSGARAAKPESEEWYLEGVKLKPDTPNVLNILRDDMGVSQHGCFGGIITTPNIDALAAVALHYNNYHTPALCSPSGAALMAGRNTHMIGLGSHMLTAMCCPNHRIQYDR